MPSTRQLSLCSLQPIEHVTLAFILYAPSCFTCKKWFQTNICHRACSLLAELLHAFIFLQRSKVSARSSCWKREGLYYSPEGGERSARKCLSLVQLELPGCGWRASGYGPLVFIALHSGVDSARFVQQTPSVEAVEFALSQIKREFDRPSCYWPHNANDPLHGKLRLNFALCLSVKTNFLWQLSWEVLLAAKENASTRYCDQLCDQ